ncbi:MAG: hypothetical protein R2874_12765 [Desulfobacterales bacterium]
MRLKHLFILLTVVSVMGAVFDASAEVTTTRDDKGVWFVKGDASDSLYDTFKAVGYAVAQDRLEAFPCPGPRFHRARSRPSLCHAHIFQNDI